MLSILIICGIIAVFYARTLYLELEETKKQLKEVIEINHQIYEQLIDATQELEELKYGKSETRTQNKKANDFLSADDPMEAILSQVGVKKGTYR